MTISAGATGHVKDLLGIQNVHPWSGHWKPRIFTGIGDEIGDGGAMYFDGFNYLTYFYGRVIQSMPRYHLNENTHVLGLVPPATIGIGAAMAIASGRDVYMTRGHSTTTFWRFAEYDGAQWTGLAVVPAVVTAGGALAYGGGDYVWCICGSPNFAIQRYSITGNNWVSVGWPYVGNPGCDIFFDGTWLYFMQGGGSKTWLKRNMTTGQIIFLAQPPQNISTGGSIAWDNGNFVYCLAGGTTKHFMRYDIEDDAWDTLEDTPENVGAGSRLKFVAPGTLYAFRGGVTRDFWRYFI